MRKLLGGLLLAVALSCQSETPNGRFTIYKHSPQLSPLLLDKRSGKTWAWDSRTNSWVETGFLSLDALRKAQEASEAQSQGRAAAWAVRRQKRLAELAKRFPPLSDAQIDEEMKRLTELEHREMAKDLGLTYEELKAIIGPDSEE